MGGSTEAHWHELFRSARVLHILAVYASASFVVLQAVDIFVAQFALPRWVFPSTFLLLLALLPLVLAAAVVKAARSPKSDAAIERVFTESAPSMADRAPRPTALGLSASVVSSATDSRRPAVGTLVAAGIALLIAIRAMVILIGLPDWFWQGAAGLVAAGSAIVLLREWRVRGRRTLWLTRRRALVMGGVALFVIVILASGFASSRRLGVGPFATPISRGQLDSIVSIVLADVAAIGVDLSYGDAVTSLLRTDLQQSATIRPLPVPDVHTALARMRRESDRLDAETALELARREGVAGVLTGEIRRVGGKYLLMATFTSADAGGVVVSERETARDSTELITAAERLSHRIRASVGENLRDLRSSYSLERVTTASFPALVAFTQGARANIMEGNFTKAIRLLEQAVAHDSTFAMAYYVLTGVGFNADQPGLARRAAEKAYRHRNRLPEAERLLVEWTQHNVMGDEAAEEDVLRQVMGMQPLRAWVLLSDLRLRQRRFAAAESAALRALEVQSGSHVALWNALEAYVAQGRIAVADSLIELKLQPSAKEPQSGDIEGLRLQVLLAKRDYLAAEKAFASHIAEPAYASTPPRLALTLGRLADAERLRSGEADLMWLRYRLRYGVDRAAITRQLDPILQQQGSLSPDQREYHLFVPLLAELGRVSDARRLLLEWQKLGQDHPRFAGGVDESAGSIALAEGRWHDAATAFLRWHRAPFSSAIYPFNRGLFEAGQAMDHAARPDSAVVLYERAIAQLALFGFEYEVLWYPFALSRLGELYDAKGEATKAAEYYSRFIDLWRNADPALQPRVRAAQNALTRLRRS